MSPLIVEDRFTVISSQYLLRMIGVTNKNERELVEIEEPKKLVLDPIPLTNDRADSIHFRLRDYLRLGPVHSAISNC